MPKTIKPTVSPSINIREYERESPFVWSINNVLLPKGAKWKFDDRAWQVAIFDDLSPHTVVIKPTQIGMSTISLCRFLHFAAMHRARLMYTLPRQDDVNDFVNSRFDEVIRESPNLLKLVGQIDNVRLKMFGQSFLHFMESSVTPRMLDVDYLVNDEVDLSNQDYLEQYVSRLDASEYGHHHRLSTPTLHNFGIHMYYERSDKKQWMVKCPRCSYEFWMDWDSNVRHKNGETWYVCAKCDRQLDREVIQSGRWVATGPANAMYSGYAVSQLMTTYISPARLYEESKVMTPRNFFNLRLGQPYTPTLGSLNKSEIYEKCFDSGHNRESSGSGYFLGADQGNEIHVAVGKHGENGELQIVHLEVIPFEEGFERLESLIEKYRVKKAVIDGLPNKHSAHQLASRYHNRVLCAFYTNVDIIYRQDKSEPKVNISKTDSYDQLQSMISEGKLQFYGNKNIVDIKTRDVITHLSNMRRDESVQKTVVGGERTVIYWTNTGPDHYADAINYLQIAADMGGSAGFRVSRIGSGESQEGAASMVTPDKRMGGLRALWRSKSGFRSIS